MRNELRKGCEWWRTGRVSPHASTPHLAYDIAILRFAIDDATFTVSGVVLGQCVAVCCIATRYCNLNKRPTRLVESRRPKTGKGDNAEMTTQLGD